MSIFDLFSFKKQAQLIFTKENFSYILNLAKNEILKRAKEALEGYIKKAQVDLIVIGAIDKIISNYSITNKLVLWIIDSIKKVIPDVTQFIYDSLKAKIEEL